MSEKKYDVARSISQAMQDKEHLKRTGAILKRMIDGEPKNINPIKEMPIPEMTLYSVHGQYFETELELEQYCKDKNIDLSHSYVNEYYREFAGRNDVIRRLKKGKIGTFYTVSDTDGYGIYNYDRSIYRGEFVWEYNYGSLSDWYKIFRDKGIVFENDIYLKEEDRYNRIIKELKKIDKKKQKRLELKEIN